MSKKLSTMNQARSSVFGNSMKLSGVKLTTGGNKQTKQQHVQLNKPMKKLAMLLALGATVALMPSVSKASLLGSAHDFSPTGGYGAAATNGLARFVWGGETNTYNNPCQVCHIPHKSQAYATAHAPLWNHKLSANTYITYDSAGSETYKGGTIVLGSSIACLSCHDGSVAINQTSGSSGSSKTNSLSGTAVYAPSFSIETLKNGVAASGAGPYVGFDNLTQMHPIGVSYTACVSAGDDELQETTYDLLPKMLKGTSKNVECASCHDIHRTTGASATVSHELIMDLEGGALCLECHKK